MDKPRFRLKVPIELGGASANLVAKEFMEEKGLTKENSISRDFQEGNFAVKEWTLRSA